VNRILEIFKSWRVIIFVIAIILAVLAINPRFGETGIEIKSIVSNSSAELSGLKTGEIIQTINGEDVKNLGDYQNVILKINPGDIVKLKTEKSEYSFLAEGQNITEIGFEASVIPSSNIKQGLDLVGGVRVLLEPEIEISAQEMDDILTITKKRLNVYGLADILVRETKDLEGNSYILVEIAGATKEEVVDLLEKQGKFEAKIGNESIFLGGTDIKYVERSAQGGAGVRNCDEFQNGWQCSFQFPVTVTIESAKKHMDVTSKLTVELVDNKQYLSKKLDLYLDDELVDSLYISADLQGQEATTFVIQGPGVGRTRDEALLNAVENMKKFQTVLITGSLPVKLNIAKMDLISPTLGQEFFKYAIIALVAAILAVGVAVSVRYRKIKIAIPIILIGLSEIIIILGVAALIQWNLDLAAIAAILASVGTGVDHQIVITDEVLKGEEEGGGNWKEKMKRAFFIIMVAYFTIVVAMLPLWAMGAGLLKGFAIITIIGVSIGVFITRPAYAKIIEELNKK